MSASRIGTCSSNLKLTKTILNTDGRGCSSDQGLSKGTLVSGCAASGAGHGGSGGFGSKLAIDESESRCRDGAPKAYPTKDTDAHLEGSGGGSSNELFTKGGDGGGIIWLSATNRMILRDNSEIRAEGSDGVLIKRTPGDPQGSGGGSGGAI